MWLSIAVGEWQVPYAYFPFFFFVLSYFFPASAGHVVGAVVTHVPFTHQLIKCQRLILSICITDGRVVSAAADTKSVLQLLKEQSALITWEFCFIAGLILCPHLAL